MPSLFLPPSAFSSSEIIIENEQAHYLTNVLRLQKGQNITLFDGCGNRYHARCVSFTKKEVRLIVMSTEKVDSLSPSLSIILAQAVIKSSKMDLIIEKATELGVNKIIPLITERTQIRQTGRLTRWNTIARSAAQQSSRAFIPHILSPQSFKDFLLNDYKGIVLWEKESSRNFKRILKSFHSHDTLTLVIGPEGGFTDKEVEMAQTHSLTVTSFGPRILRTETAAISALSIVQYELGDLK